ncbi:MAG: hypothetical protein ABFS14_11815, partial [Gemmatimonadota bacterium]
DLEIGLAPVYIWRFWSRTYGIGAGSERNNGLIGFRFLKAPLPGILFAATAFSLFLPSIAEAQEERINSPYRFIDSGGRVGVFLGHVGTRRGNLGLGIGPSTVAGARLRGRLSSPLSIEISIGVGSSDRSVIDPREPSFPDPVDTVSVTWALIDANFQIALTGARSLHRLQPFVTLGFGVLRGVGEDVSAALVDPSDASFRFRLGTSPSATFGLGTEWHVANGIGISFEMRDHLWRMKTPEGFFRLDILEMIQDSGGPVPSDTEWTHNLEFSVGAFYYF